MRTKDYTVLQKKALYPIDAVITSVEPTTKIEKRHMRRMITAAMIKTTIDTVFDNTEIRAFYYKKDKMNLYNEVIAIPDICAIITLHIFEGTFEIALYDGKYSQLLFSCIRENHGDLEYRLFITEFTEILSWIDKIGYSEIKIDDDIIRKLRESLPLMSKIIAQEVEKK